jgi:hypothetical protein
MLSQSHLQQLTPIVTVTPQKRIKNNQYSPLPKVHFTLNCRLNVQSVAKIGIQPILKCLLFYVGGYLAHLFSIALVLQKNVVKSSVGKRSSTCVHPIFF